jgi:hypothetical protein
MLLYTGPRCTATAPANAFLRNIKEVHLYQLKAENRSCNRGCKKYLTWK